MNQDGIPTTSSPKKRRSLVRSLSKRLTTNIDVSGIQQCSGEMSIEDKNKLPTIIEVSEESEEGQLFESSSFQFPRTLSRVMSTSTTNITRNTKRKKNKPDPISSSTKIQQQEQQQQTLDSNNQIITDLYVLVNDLENRVKYTKEIYKHETKILLDDYKSELEKSKQEIGYLTESNNQLQIERSVLLDERKRLLQEIDSLKSIIIATVSDQVQMTPMVGIYNKPDAPPLFNMYDSPNYTPSHYFSSPSSFSSRSYNVSHQPILSPNQHQLKRSYSTPLQMRQKARTLLSANPGNVK